MTKRLIVNADDFCLSDGVCRGVLRAMEQGVVTSTTAMACVDGAIERLQRYGSLLPGGLGVHLQLTAGTPCLPPKRVPSLVDGSGRFPDRKKRIKSLDPDEVRAEWSAQVERLLGLGYPVTHLDGHHHCHARKDTMDIALDVAAAHKLAVRALDEAMAARARAKGVPSPRTCLTGWYAEDLTPERFLILVDEAFGRLGEDAVVEIMVHPGKVTPQLVSRSSYLAGRELELEALSDPGLAEELDRRGIERIDFSALSAKSGSERGE